MQFPRLFPTVKTAALYLVPIRSYSKNTHTSFISKWIIVPFPERELKGDSKVSTPFCKSTLFIGIYIYRVDRNIQFCRE